MLRAIINSVAIVGGVIILSRHIKPVWQIVIATALIVLGLVTSGIV